MKLTPEDEVFVCLKWNRDDPSKWEVKTVKNVTQRFLYLNFSPLTGKRISLETMSSPPYLIFIPTEEERLQQAEAELRSSLISTIIRADLGSFKTQSLQELSRIIESAKTPVDTLI